LRFIVRLSKRISTLIDSISILVRVKGITAVFCAIIPIKDVIFLITNTGRTLIRSRIHLAPIGALPIGTIYE